MHVRREMSIWSLRSLRIRELSERHDCREIYWPQAVGLLRARSGLISGMEAILVDGR